MRSVIVVEMTPEPEILSGQRLEEDDARGIDALRETYGRLRSELGKVIVGQSQVMEELSICLFARGHSLLMGVPGLAKTLLVSKLSETLSLKFSRIQFTPDLMPMDITGTEIIQETASGHREFNFIHGPVFANIVLADEINRAPAKTQAAMLEAMQEHKVTVIGKEFRLPQPFFVLATQNPVEQEGTYPLPEAQLDRFMFLIQVNYPTEAEEIEIAKSTTGNVVPKLESFLSGEQLLKYQELVRRIPVPTHIYEYIVRLVRRSRPSDISSPDWVKRFVSWGAGTRAVQNLVLGSKARSALHGRYFVSEEDVQAVIEPVLNHRIITNFAAQSEGMGTIEVIRKLISETPTKIS